MREKDLVHSPSSDGNVGNTDVLMRQLPGHHLARRFD